MRCAAAALALLSLFACTSQLSRAGSTVRGIPPESASRCRYLGPVEGFHANGSSIEDNELGATNELRNRVASLGGNAFAITGRTSSMWRTALQASAYLCPGWEPVHGLPPG